MSNLDRRETSLTKRAVDALAPEPERYTVWDAALPGFGVRVTPQGAKIFIVKVRVGRGRSAQQRWITLGRFGAMTLDGARAEARAALARALIGQEPDPRPTTDPLDMLTVEALCQRWLERGALRSRGAGARFGQLRSPKNILIDKGRIHAHIVPLIGRVRLKDLQRRHITTMRDDIARGATKKVEYTKPRGKRVVGGGDGTATRTVRLLSSILSFGVREGLIDANPAIGVETTPDKMRTRFLSKEEASRLGEALRTAEDQGVHPYGIAVIRLLAMSGARKGEIEGLKWSDIDEGTGHIRLAMSKTGPRLIQLTEPMIAILRATPRVAGTEYVFPAYTLDKPFHGVPQAWKTVRAMAGLEDVRLHDLRHSAASFALANGVPLEVIGRLLGHRDVKTTRRYAHLADEVAKVAAERTAAIVQDLFAGKAGPSKDG